MPQSSTLNPQASAPDPDSEAQTPNPKPHTPNPESANLYLNLLALNPEPQTFNPGLGIELEALPDVPPVSQILNPQTYVSTYQPSTQP